MYEKPRSIIAKPAKTMYVVVLSTINEPAVSNLFAIPMTTSIAMKPPITV